MSGFDCTQIENYEDLRKMQLTMLDILKYIDRFCRDNHIRYSLSGGTLLGAVRHDGFIPWDDDLDICMLRSEYDRFIELWKNSEHGEYLIQTKESAPKYTQSFAKIRKDHTTFYQKGEIPGDYHMGVFVDIFPIDRIPDGFIKKFIFYWQVIRYQIYVREFIPPNTNFVVKGALKIVYSITSPEIRKTRRKKLLERITKNNSDTSLRLVGIDTLSTMKKSFSADLLDSYTKIKFEDERFPCFSNWNEYLTKFYGDYMTLPPKEQRTWYHHPVILDFEHNYEELPPEKRELGI